MKLFNIPSFNNINNNVAFKRNSASEENLLNPVVLENDDIDVDIERLNLESDTYGANPLKSFFKGIVDDISGANEPSNSKFGLDLIA
ncbi:MAG: hypothetical protein WCK67_12595 [bacterium]